MKSKLLFESFSNSSKSVNLVSHSLLAHDTRFTGCSGSTEGKHNVFDCVLQPSRTGTNRASLQLELHYRSGPTNKITFKCIPLVSSYHHVAQDWLPTEAKQSCISASMGNIMGKLGCCWKRNQWRC